MLQDRLGDLSGKHAVVIGRSNIVGKPMALLLLQQSCTVTIVHSRTKNIEALCQQADILVAAVGRPHFVKADWVKPGAVVIDVGINRIEQDGKSRLVGDVDFDAVSEVAAAITPVPGGVGPMTIACLMYNTVAAAKMQHGLV
jgi:methylenetetrahydrofolate dehydrogenase (NADP+)/methenyltetrahydrofolate cyclohydrolase